MRLTLFLLRGLGQNFLWHSRLQKRTLWQELQRKSSCVADVASQ